MRFFDVQYKKPLSATSKNKSVGIREMISKENL